MVIITRAEWRWAIIVSLGVLIFSTIPTLAGYLSQTPDAYFGGAVFDRTDYFVHTACVQMGLRGEWLYADWHTSERVPAAFVRTFYITLGQLGRLLPLSVPALFELARWLCGLWMLLTLYALSARFLWSIALRRVAFLLGALGSGVGWLMLLVQWQPQPGMSPIDFWLLDLYGFFSLLTFPHIAAVMALMWTALLAMLAHWESSQKYWLIIAVSATLVAQIIQPFAPVVVDVVLALFALSRTVLDRRSFPWASLALLAVLQIPLAIYAATFFYLDPVWSSFTEQNVTLSPEPIYYVLGLGMVGVLAVWGAWRVSRRKFSQAHVLVIWLMVVAVLAYLPFQFQRRFTEGLIGPLAILAAIGLGRGLMPTLRRWSALRRALMDWHYPFARVRNLGLVLIVGVAALSSAYLALGGALLGIARSPQLFDPSDVVQAIDWLGAQGQAMIWSAERTGVLIPARIGQRVYLGHQFETARYEIKTANVARFFDVKTSEDERVALLRECGCRFVFLGPYERALGDYVPEQSVFLGEVYSNASVRVYQIYFP